jgi:hypothetical protein
MKRLDHSQWNVFRNSAPQLLGPADVAKVIRMQLARIRPGVRIVPHVDLGGWARRSHRIHVPIVTSPDVAFEVSSTATSIGCAIAHTTTACDTLAVSSE